MRRQSMSPQRPPGLVECYWVLPGQFLAGEYPAHIERPQAIQRLDALLAAGLDSFFDLTEPGELQPYLPLLQQRASLKGSQISYQRFPIVDLGLPDRAGMLALLAAIESALAHGRRIYAHCWGGIGRTGLTVGCFLVHRGYSGPQALKQIAAWRRSQGTLQSIAESPETAEQIQFVLHWREAAPVGKE
jgi:hypothetical protein